MAVEIPLMQFPSCPAGELFAQAPVDQYPGVAVETVSDSSRYFILRIQDDGGELERMKNLCYVFFFNSGTEITPHFPPRPPIFILRSYCVHWHRVRGPGGRFRFQCGFAGSLQVCFMFSFQFIHFFIEILSHSMCQI